MSAITEYFEIVCKSLSIEDIVKQVRAINKFPATVKIYDRIIRIDTKEERYSLIDGLEVGAYHTLDDQEDGGAFKRAREMAVQYHEKERDRWTNYAKQAVNERFKEQFLERSTFHQSAAFALYKIREDGLI